MGSIIINLNRLLDCNSFSLMLIPISLLNSVNLREKKTTEFRARSKYAFKVVRIVYMAKVIESTQLNNVGWVQSMMNNREKIV